MRHLMVQRQLEKANQVMEPHNKYGNTNKPSFFSKKKRKKLLL